jgi:hypothetical protein
MRSTLLLLSFGLFLASCASVPKLSPAQRRLVQNRIYDRASYENVFRSFKAVLQDEDAIIRNQDAKEGFILAVIQKTAKTGAFWELLGKASDKYHFGDTFELQVNVMRASSGGIETRLSIETLAPFTLAGEKGEEVLSPELYAGLYQKVNIEVERRRPASQR